MILNLFFPCLLTSSQLNKICEIILHHFRAQAVLPGSDIGWNSQQSTHSFYSGEILPPGPKRKLSCVRTLSTISSNRTLYNSAGKVTGILLYSLLNQFLHKLSHSSCRSAGGLFLFDPIITVLCPSKVSQSCFPKAAAVTFWQACHRLTPHPPWVLLYFLFPAWFVALLSALCPLRDVLCFMFHAISAPVFLAPPWSIACHAQRLPMSLVAWLLQVDHPSITHEDDASRPLLDS